MNIQDIKIGHCYRGLYETVREVLEDTGPMFKNRVYYTKGRTETVFTNKEVFANWAMEEIPCSEKQKIFQRGGL